LVNDPKPHSYTNKAEPHASAFLCPDLSGNLTKLYNTRLSPLNNRFPITNRIEAMLEAKALTEERVKL
jgi:hypothetical protein